MWGHLKFAYEVPNLTKPYGAASNQTMPSQTKACIAKLSFADEREKRAYCSSISADSRALWVICYSTKMSGHVEKKAASVKCFPNGIEQGCDARSKLMVINYNEIMNNCSATKKISVSEANIWSWRRQKQKLINATSTQKSFSGPKHGHCQELKQEIVEFICLKEKNWSARYMWDNKI